MKKNEDIKPQWAINCDQYRAHAKKLEERASILIDRPSREDQELAMRLRRQARELASKATQIEAYFLYGEIVTLRR